MGKKEKQNKKKEEEEDKKKREKKKQLIFYCELHCAVHSKSLSPFNYISTVHSKRLSPFNYILILINLNVNGSIEWRVCRVPSS
jgi:hypothetical protein